MTEFSLLSTFTRTTTNNVDGDSVGYSIGSDVVVHGLHNQKNLDGEYGKTVSNLESGRYKIYIGILKKTVQIKPSNTRVANLEPFRTLTDRSKK